MKLIFLLVIFSLVIISIFNEEVYGQTPTHSSGFDVEITVINYDSNKMIVTGHTIYYTSDVTFKIISPSGNNVVVIGQILPDDDGKFMIEFDVDTTWNEDGFYTITAQQNSLYTLNVEVEVNNGQTEETNMSDGLFRTQDITEITTSDINLAYPGCVNAEVGCYTPKILTVQAGDIIRMTNTDEAGIHTFTSGTVDGFAATADGTFDSGILQSNYFVELDTSNMVIGEYPYYCMLHVWMQGMIIVEEGGNIEPVVETLPLTITTDQITYLDGNTIYISGNFNNSHNGTSITISLQSPNGHLSPVHNIITTNNNNYSTTIQTTNNPYFTYQGNYTLTAHYNNQTTATTFYYNSTTQQEEADNYFIPDEQYLTLSDRDLNKWNNELTKWQNAQNRTDVYIDRLEIKLDQAITRNNTNQIELFTEKIGNAMALSSLYDGIIECLIEELDLLS